MSPGLTTDGEKQGDISCAPPAAGNRENALSLEHALTFLLRKAECSQPEMTIRELLPHADDDGLSDSEELKRKIALFMEEEESPSHHVHS